MAPALKEAPDTRSQTRFQASYVAENLTTNRDQLRLCGRLTAIEQGRGVLSREGDVASFRCAGELAELRCGDLVALEGYREDGLLVVERAQVLARSSIPWGTRRGDWQRFDACKGRLRHHLRQRAAVLDAVRDFFKLRGFLEVETPALVRYPCQEPHLQLFETRFHTSHSHLPVFLIPSPELHMKRLLGSGFERLFQLSRCFRNGERSALHNPEFTMLEWYRAFAGYEEIMEDTEALVCHVANAVHGVETLEYQGRQIDLKPPWSRITVDQAFLRWANVDLQTGSSAAVLRQQAWSLGYRSVTERDSWEDIFFKLLLERVEPALRAQGAIFLKDYPACMASLARIKADDPAVAERAEAYVAGMELANGFSELNDPTEQQRRFLADQRRREEAGYPCYPLDEEFLEMLEQGMPPAGGMALGIDRLVMLLLDTDEIDEVIAFPFSG